MDCGFEKQICDAVGFLHRNRISSASGTIISAIDRVDGTVFIRSKNAVGCDDICSCSLSGSDLSEDAGIHVGLYRQFDSVGSIILLKSYYVSLFVQAQMPLKKLDICGKSYFASDIPCSVCVSSMTEAVAAVSDLYESISSDPAKIPAVIVPPLGAFVFGNSPFDVAEYAYILEKTAMYRYRISEFNLVNTDDFDSLSRFDVKRRLRGSLHSK